VVFVLDLIDTARRMAD